MIEIQTYDTLASLKRKDAEKREKTLRPSGFAFEKPWGDNRLRTCATIKQKTAIWGRFWAKLGIFG